MRESEVEKYFCRAIQAEGGVAMKFVSPGRAGVPDRVALLPGGRVAFVELKTDTGTLSRVQRAQIRRMQALGVPVYVACGKAGVDRVLSRLREEVMPDEVHAL